MENKTNKPKLFLVLKIIGFIAIAVGVSLIIYSTTIKVPELGEPGWFDLESKQNGFRFGGITCCMFSVPLLIFGFMTEIAKASTKTAKYIQDQNKADLTDMANTSADIASGSITKTARALRDGFVGEKIYCKHCGQAIDTDSKFCSKCGNPQ